MARVCYMHEKRTEMHTDFWQGKLKEGEHLGQLGLEEG
jgi:hypothetical protein